MKRKSKPIPTFMLYRVHLKLFGASMGYQFYTSMEHAKKFAAAFAIDHVEEEPHCVIESKTVELSNVGVMKLCQHWAMHPKGE